MKYPFKGKLVSKNIIIFFLFVGGIFYLAHKKMKEQIETKKTKAVVSENLQQKTLQETSKVNLDDGEASDEETIREGKSDKLYKRGYFVCPKELRLTPYGLSSKPSPNGFYFKDSRPMILASKDYGVEQITCNYRSNLGGVYYLYQRLKGKECLPMNEGVGVRCNQEGNIKSYRCWEIRTSANEKPYLRFFLEGTQGEKISKENGWEYDMPKGFASSAQMTKEDEMECAYSISVSNQFTLVNKVTKFKDCILRNEGVECY